jgi:hypothetical protein
VAKRRYNLSIRQPGQEESTWFDWLPVGGYSRWANYTARRIEFGKAFWPPMSELSLPNEEAKTAVKAGATFLRVNT